MNKVIRTFRQILNNFQSNLNLLDRNPRFGDMLSYPWDNFPDNGVIFTFIIRVILRQNIHQICQLIFLAEFLIIVKCQQIF